MRHIAWQLYLFQPPAPGALVGEPVVPPALDWADVVGGPYKRISHDSVSACAAGVVCENRQGAGTSDGVFITGNERKSA